MAQWNHNICWQCWFEKGMKEAGEVRVPVRIGGEIADLDRYCCFCGHRNIEGIFIREDPATMLCDRYHKNEEN